jgi:hypothetical protein
MKPKKLNKRARSAIRKAKIASGSYVAPPKPVAKKKKKPSPAPGARDRKPKASPAPGARLTSPPAQPLPEFAAVERRPYLAPRRDYFLGSGILKKLPNPLPDGWVLSTDERPGPEFRLAAIRVFRVADGDYVKLCRYMLRDEIVAEMREHAERVRREIAIDDGNARARKDLALLVAKNRRNGQPTRMFYK